MKMGFWIKSEFWKKSFLSFLIVTWLFFGCKKPADEESAQAPLIVVEVKMDSLKMGNAEDVVVASGITDVLKKETVASPTAGRLLSLKVSEGMSIAPGNVVAVLRTKESESIIEGARTLLAAAQSDAEKQEAQRAVELAEKTGSTLSLRTKQGGVVASRLVHEGEQVAENTNLITLVDLSTLIFLAEIPMTELGRIKVGQSATIHFSSLPEAQFLAQVDAILPQAQAASQTLSLRLKFIKSPSDHLRKLLKTDMVGDVRIVLSTRKNVLLAPKAAIQRDDETGHYSLMKVSGDSIARRIEVIPGATQVETPQIEIRAEGLATGDKVIVQGQHGLADSTKVKWLP